MTDEVKTIFVRCDPNIIRATSIMILCNIAGYDYESMPKIFDKDGLHRLLQKADLYQDTGGAKLAAIIVHSLLDIFAGIDNNELERARILSEMILTMGIEVAQSMQASSAEGPKREPVDTQ